MNNLDNLLDLKLLERTNETPQTELSDAEYHQISTEMDDLRNKIKTGYNPNQEELRKIVLYFRERRVRLFGKAQETAKPKKVRSSVPKVPKRKATPAKQLTTDDILGLLDL